MHRVLLTATRLFLVALLLGGVVVLGQTIGIAAGSGALVELFGTSVTDVACTVAAVTGVLAFLLLYTREGKVELDE